MSVPSRDNRGMQVALVLFVMTTVVLAVTTIVFFRHYDEANVRTRVLAAELRQSGAAVRALADEVVELKRLIGHPADAPLDTVVREHAEQLGLCAAHCPEPVRAYRPVVAVLDRVIRERNAELAASRADLAELKTRLEQREKGSEARLVAMAAVIEHARRDVAAVGESFGRQREAMERNQEAVRRTLGDSHQRADAAAAEAKARIDALETKYLDAVGRLDKALKELDDIKRADYEVPQGEIRAVNHRLRVAWIDLGRADGLRPQVGFDVYQATARRLNGSTKKGAIEVTRLLDDHLAQAAIVEDRVSDPLGDGDKIHTPLWRPAER